MTREEVIKYLEQHGFIDDEVKDMCIEALEKQILKKLDKVKIYDKTYFVCPICKFPLHSRHKFCHCCGQALDWSEEND